MKRFRAEIVIQASPARVWEVLTNVDDYPSWDPGMERIEGYLALGQKVKFFTKFSPEKAFPVKVTGFEPSQKMVLTGGMPFGLFKSERTHLLVSQNDQQTSFSTEETFSGLLFPLFGNTIPDLTESFQNFVAGLKEQAEKRR